MSRGGSTQQVTAVHWHGRCEDLTPPFPQDRGWEAAVVSLNETLHGKYLSGSE